MSNVIGYPRKKQSQADALNELRELAIKLIRGTIVGDLFDGDDPIDVSEANIRVRAAIAVLQLRDGEQHEVVSVTIRDLAKNV